MTQPRAVAANVGGFLLALLGIPLLYFDFVTGFAAIVVGLIVSEIGKQFGGEGDAIERH